jgi:hypothetical protein
LRRRTNSSPSMPGITRSVMTALGGSRSIRTRASSADDGSLGFVSPGLEEASQPLSSPDSSSTTRMRSPMYSPKSGVPSLPCPWPDDHVRGTERAPTLAQFRHDPEKQRQEQRKPFPRRHRRSGRSTQQGAEAAFSTPRLGTPTVPARVVVS